MAARVIDDKELRFCIGVIGLAYPWVLILPELGRLPDGHLESLSAYYDCLGFTRDFFVAGLSSIGVFLWSYRGYPGRTWLLCLEETHLGRIAGLAAIGVAFCPVSQIPKPHYICAAILFGLLAFFALQFTKNEPLRLKIIFILCATVIIGASLACVWAEMHDRPIIWYETAVVDAFGLAWLFKSKFEPLCRITLSFRRKKGQSGASRNPGTAPPTPNPRTAPPPPDPGTAPPPS